MTLGKWRSSSVQLLESIPEELREKSNLHIIPAPGDCGKALRIHWDTDKDFLHVATPEFKTNQPSTKRYVSSIIAKIFDMLGWYSPAVLPAKLLLQELWKLKVSWDDPLPENMLQKWKTWLQEIPCITQHSIPRHMGKAFNQVHSRQLHGFCDASLWAYGGVVYLRTLYTDTTISVSIVMSKSRVAPIKPQTIPRLELCGALMLSILLCQVSTDLSLPEDSVYAWTDSAIVLGWLKTHPGRLKVFVAHGVAEITSIVGTSHWRYVDTLSNPADLVSRGVMPAQLIKSSIWWEGPTWLSHSPARWPRRPDINRGQELPDLSN